MSGPNPPDHEADDLPGQRAGQQLRSTGEQRDRCLLAGVLRPRIRAVHQRPLRAGGLRPLRLRQLRAREHWSNRPNRRGGRGWSGWSAIVAAIALVVSVSVLVTRTDTSNLATPATTTTTPPPPVQDEITTTTPPPPPPPPPPDTNRRPAAGDRDRDPGAGAASATTTAAEAPPPPPETAPPPPPATTRAGPRQVTYSVTGTKAPRRHHLGHLHRRVGSQPHPTKRLHSVVSDRHADFAVRGRLGAGLQPVPGEQAQLLDHDQRRHGAFVEYQQLRTDSC